MLDGVLHAVRPFLCAGFGLAIQVRDDVPLQPATARATIFAQDQAHIDMSSSQPGCKAVSWSIQGNRVNGHKHSIFVLAAQAAIHNRIQQSRIQTKFRTPRQATISLG
jgi:hypothetical protein